MKATPARLAFACVLVGVGCLASATILRDKNGAPITLSGGSGFITIPEAESGTIHASDGTLANVQSLHDSTAVNGDTITIPTGTNPWNGILTITKAITIAGLGTATLDGNGRATSCPAVIRDDKASGNLINVSLVANQNTRFTNVEIVSGGNRTPGDVGGILDVSGVNTDARRMRIDHCVFDHVGISAFTPHTMLGVFDANTVLTDNQVGCCYVKCESWGGTQGVDSFGDGSYVEAANFGSEEKLYIENNNLTGTWIGHLTMIDGGYGGRVVIRRNTITNGSIENHGSESDRGRSGRAGELYDNIFIGNDGGGSVLFSRGGVWVVHGNTVTDYGPTPGMNLLDDRSREPLFAPFGGADGRNPWDVNHASNPFDTGTVTTATALETTGVSKSIFASGESWTDNQWAGYTLRRTSGKTVSSLTLVSGFIGTATCTAHGFVVDDWVSIWGADQYAWNYLFRVASVPDADHFTFLTNWATTTPATGTIKAAKGSSYAEIYSNTATKLVYNDTVYYAVYPSRVLSLAIGDTFEINKVSEAMDQVGRGSGSNLGAVLVPSLPGGGLVQAAEPNYEWDNTYESGGDLNFTIGAVGGPHLIIQSGVHFHNNTTKPGYTPLAYPHPLVQ